MSEPRMARPRKNFRRWKTGCSSRSKITLRDELQELLAARRRGPSSSQVSSLSWQ